MFRAGNKGKDHLRRAALLSALLAVSCSAGQDSLHADRTAIERVYYDHRLGNKPPFEEILPPSLIEELVRKDLRKEAALHDVYGVEVSTEMLEAEVQRINTTTRAPEMLAEIKAALDNNPARFAHAFAKPIVVERLLREKFENDDALHAARRKEVETLRERLLTARTKGASAAGLRAILEEEHAGHVTDRTWHLRPRPAEPAVQNRVEELEIKKRFGPDAKLLSSPDQAGVDPEFYFEDLPVQLQNVLRVQLQEAGDVSAVIEMPRGFLLYLAEQKTDETLRAATLSLPKQDYDQWVGEQSAGAK